MKLLSKKNTQELIIATIEDQHCRLHHMKKGDTSLTQFGFTEFEFTDFNELDREFNLWGRQFSDKGLLCRWVLAHDRYQTFQIDPPKVSTKEMDEAVKWQIKDLLDFSVNDAIVSYYEPKQPDSHDAQIVAVSVTKQLVETLIEITRKSGLEMESIEVGELSVGHALKPYLAQDKIVGFIGENKSGLLFNFYNGKELSFSRHKKGRFLPNTQTQEFSLEQDKKALEENFLLETQRTLDYVVTQLFRRPVDGILLQKSSDEDNYLADVLKQITEIEVTLINSTVEQHNPQFSIPDLIEMGTALREVG